MILPFPTLVVVLSGGYLLVTFMDFVMSGLIWKIPYSFGIHSLRENISADSLSQPLYVYNELTLKG